ncbi:GbsR/MarR family transcriptional regulator [Streptomyces sp. NPDC057654]|uniref:GbsR/MarR family transcriptional regulator n=1 Tax=Streptomyces sp. NPDC057654 TaxID=3346196 RepID=UPI0036A0F714
MSEQRGVEADQRTGADRQTGAEQETDPGREADPGQARDSGPERGRDPEGVSRFVERFAGELTESGMQRMAARVFVALLASDTAALTSAELAEQLKISPAAVSGAVRYLTSAGMISREREPGSRRDRYRLHEELWYATFASRDQHIIRWVKLLGEGAQSLGPDTPAGERVTETVEFFQFMHDELLGMLERWRVHRDAKSGPGA